MRNMIAQHKIVQLKNNYIPKGLIPLELFSDQTDVANKSFVRPQVDEVGDYNIGTENDPKFVKLSKYLHKDNK